MWCYCFLLKKKNVPFLQTIYESHVKYLIDAQGRDTMIGSASKAYKEANNRSQVHVSLDPSSESLQEETSYDSQSEGGALISPLLPRMISHVPLLIR